MKKMKKSFFRLFDKMIVTLLGCSGVLIGCDWINPQFEYGSPHADFELKGTVTDVATAQPIKNIRVVRPHFLDFESEYIPGDTIYTDEKGQYAFTFGGDLRGGNYQLKFEDIDGEDNGGLFQTKEIEGQFTQADLVEKGDGRWYDGKFAKTEDVALDPEEYQVEPMYGPPTTSFQP